jgi:hypothetical protein
LQKRLQSDTNRLRRLLTKNPTKAMFLLSLLETVMEQNGV